MAHLVNFLLSAEMMNLKPSSIVMALQQDLSNNIEQIVEVKEYKWLIVSL